jgi:hypothetical protein
MLADTMMPEAFERGGRYVGLATTAGFGLAFAISTNSPDARPLPFRPPGGSPRELSLATSSPPPRGVTKNRRGGPPAALTPRRRGITLVG